MVKRKKSAPAQSFPGGRGLGMFLYLAVFISGGSILVLEIAAGRVMAPHFGNTIYNWTSMIGIILAALSVGYAAGGRLADRRPSPRLFFLLMLAGAGLVALVPALRLALLPAFEASMSVRSGPLFGGIFLFAAPSLVLGMLTPFAVKLVARNEATLGTVTGNLFTWSTVGSIVGTFATGFVFIPTFGLNSIFLATGVTLAAISLLGLYLFCLSDGKRRGAIGGLPTAIFAWVGSAFLVGAATSGSPPGLTEETIYFQENMYHTIRVYERDKEGGRVRELYLDFQPEGAMVVGDDRALHFEYTKFLEMTPLAVPDLRRALFIGGGAFTMAKALHLIRPEAEISVAELDPEVVDVGRKFFRLGNYPKIHVAAEDGRRHLRRAPGKWDLIVGDAYRGLRTIPSHLITREFFVEIRERLAARGAFFINLIAFRAGPGAPLYAAVYRTITAVFPEVWVFSTDPQRPTVPQNILFLAFREKKAGRAREFMGRIEREARLGFIAQGRVPPPGLRVYGPELTDDFSPVENLIEKGY